MTGQSITSSHQGMENLTMTSTTCNQCAEPVMVGSKTGCCNELHGAILDTNRGRTKTGRGKYWGDPMPRLMKARRRAKHRGTWVPYGWRAQLLWTRIMWRNHWKPALEAKGSNLLTKIGNK